MGEQIQSIGRVSARKYGFVDEVNQKFYNAWVPFCKINDTMVAFWENGDLVKCENKQEAIKYAQQGKRELKERLEL